MSIDVSLEYALSASFFGLFGTSLGVSVSTGNVYLFLTCYKTVLNVLFQAMIGLIQVKQP